jgi:serine/threonine protein kinase
MKDGRLMADNDWVPSDDVLLAFNRGLLPDSQIDAVARWLEANPHGEERLRRLTEHHNDEAAEALRQPCLLDEELANLAGLSSRIVSGMLAEPMPVSADEPAAVPESIREYHLVKELGKGGMGSVYLARHRRLRRDVALKLLPARLAADPWYRGRFEREMAAVGQLDHPNLVRAHDAGAEGEHLFLAMELLDGEDLAKLVAQHRRLPIADACEAARQAARAAPCPPARSGSSRRQTGQPVRDTHGDGEGHRPGLLGYSTPA